MRRVNALAASRGVTSFLTALNAGSKELAIENYEKSLQINPGNTNGVAMLEKLRGGG